MLRGWLQVGAEDEDALRRVVLGSLALGALTILGTLGFRAIAGMTWVEAVFMTVTTLSTVGYGEIRPLGDAGRLFASALIVLGVGTALYTAGALAEFVIAGRLRELIGRGAMSRALAELRGHIIVCGYGRLGRCVVEELVRSGTAFVVIDEDPAVEQHLPANAGVFIAASAAEDSVLARAGVAEARALVAATGNEAVNLYVTLAAREANPTLAIHARADTESGARHLRRVGASHVVSPHRLGGQRLAHGILRPAVIDFLELAAPGVGAEIDLEEVVVNARSPLAELSIADLPRQGIAVSVVAIQSLGTPLRLHPSPSETFRSGDRIVVVGDRSNVTRLGELASQTS
jgi:voltage-gated potassium channel